MNFTLAGQIKNKYDEALLNSREYLEEFNEFLLFVLSDLICPEGLEAYLDDWEKRKQEFYTEDWEQEPDQGIDASKTSILQEHSTDLHMIF